MTIINVPLFPSLLYIFSLTRIHCARSNLGGLNPVLMGHCSLVFCYTQINIEKSRYLVSKKSCPIFIVFSVVDKDKNGQDFLDIQYVHTIQCFDKMRQTTF